MGLIERFRAKREVQEMPCPRCGTPAPDDAVECAACGWDLREAFHGPKGSHLQGGDAEGARPPAAG